MNQALITTGFFIRHHHFSLMVLCADFGRRRPRSRID